MECPSHEHSSSHTSGNQYAQAWGVQTLIIVLIILQVMNMQGHGISRLWIYSSFSHPINSNEHAGAWSV